MPMMDIQHIPPGRKTRVTLLALCATLMLALPMPSFAQTGRAEPDQPLAWPSIGSEQKPWTRWWWMGSAVDTANLRLNLEALSAAGIGGVEVTPIYGVSGEEHRFIDFFTPEWNRMLRFAAGVARGLGMQLDMPPGSGWRTGGPFVSPENANMSLVIDVDTVKGGQVWQRASGEARLEAATALAEGGQRSDLRQRISTDGAIAWTAPDAEWIVISAESRPSGEKVKRPGPGGAGYTIDPFSAASVDAFFEAFDVRTGEIAPGTVRAWFHDSFEYTGDGSVDLFETFHRLRGYDLADHLPALAGYGDPDEVARVKSDYRETLSDMLRANFLDRFTAWAHRRGGISRNQAHGSPGNLLDIYAASDIPETEVFGPLGGADSDPLISKFASSAAHVSGRPLVSAETGTWLEEHFTVSLDLLKQVVDQLFVSGVNHVLYHGTTYSPRDAAWPGWLFYASSQVNPRNPIWRDLPALNAYIARTQAVLQSGRPSNDVLLYWPVYDNWHDPDGLRMSFAIHNPRWFHAKPVSGVARTLWESGYGFDYVSDRQVSTLEADAAGRIAAPGATYQTIVVPQTTHMPLETMQALIELAEAGATVILDGGLPSDVPGLADLAERRAQFRALLVPLRFETVSEDVREARRGRGRILTGNSLSALLGAAGVRREALVDHEGLRFIRRARTGGYDYFISHAGSAPFDGWLPLAVPASAAGLMDPATGRTGLAQVRGEGGETAEVYVQLQPGASIIVRTFDAPIDAPAWRYIRPDGPPVELAGTWNVTFLEGGPELPPPFDTDTPASWTDAGGEAERFAGTARYTLRFDAPGDAESYLLDLGRVAESARVRLNGRDLGTLFARPFQVETGPLKSTGNVLEIDVTNLAANRIRDLDRRQVPWKIFHDINFVNLDYKPFDASDWPVRPSGLLGPVTLTPLR